MQQTCASTNTELARMTLLMSLGQAVLFCAHQHSQCLLSLLQVTPVSTPPPPSSRFQHPCEPPPKEFNTLMITAVWRAYVACPWSST